MNIKFSVITIVFNGEKEIEKTINSVISQTYNNIEYILIDGGSKDKTMSIVQKYNEFFSTIVSERDNGIYNAMNKGLSYATGDYVIFANSGDAIAQNDILEKVAKSITDCKILPELVYGNYAESKDGHVGNEIISYGHKRIWYGMFASHQSMFYKVDFIKKHNITFDESYKIAADYKFTMQTVVNGKHFLKVPYCISLFDTTGISSNNMDQGLQEADRARKEILKMGYFKRQFIIIASKLSRFIKENLNFIYKLYR